MTRVFLVVVGVLALFSVPGSSARAEAQPSAFDKAWSSVDTGAKKTAQAGDWLFEKTKAGGIRSYRATQAAGSGLSQKTKDVEIEASLKEKLATDSAVSMHSIDVTVKDGNVLMVGTVPSKNGALEATRLATEINGVRSVESRLRYAPAPSK